MNAAGGLRERRRHHTQEALVTAALELFTRDGYEATTVPVIAERAGVSVRTLFRYARDKQDLLFAQEDAMGDAVVTALTGAPSDLCPLALVRRGLEALIPQLEATRDQLPARAALIAKAPALRARECLKHAAWEDRIATALRDHHGATPVHARLAARAGIASGTAATDAWIAEGCPPGGLTRQVDEAWAALRSWSCQGS